MPRRRASFCLFERPIPILRAPSQVDDLLPRFSVALIVSDSVIGDLGLRSLISSQFGALESDPISALDWTASQLSPDNVMATSGSWELPGLPERTDHAHW